MPVIIASLFLPHTVKFEVNSGETTPNATEDNLPGGDTSSGHDAILQHSIANSILPSLSLPALTQSASTSTPPPFLKSRDSSNMQQFFKSRQKSDASSEKSEDGSAHLIKPKSRYHSKMIPSLVVETKKTSDDFGLSALRYNSSAVSLQRPTSATLPTTRTTSTPQGDFSPAGVTRTKSGFGKFGGYSINQSSTSSLAVTEEEDNAPLVFTPASKSLTLEDEDQETFSDEPLAPYGGFSRPDLEDTFLNQKNVFETAPWRIVPTDSGNGSLYKAVEAAKKNGIIHPCKWVGTMSLPVDAIPQQIYQDIGKKLSDDFDCEAVHVNDIVFQGHYKSFCKQILWPTLHYQIPDDPKSKVFEEHSFKHYKRLNQLVADKVVETYRRYNETLDAKDPENMIWVHDYHLLLVPAMIREKLPDVKIGFFLHVSFPSSEVFRCLAQREALLKGMLGADCVTFQTDEYVRHFLQTSSRLLLADTNEQGIIHNGTFTRVNTVPVGIDATALQEELSSPAVVNWKNSIRERWRDSLLLVSRDKLDKLRGVKQKLLAYEAFLKANPLFVEKTVLVEIFIGSQSNSDYKAEVMQIVSRINSMAENISIAQPVVILEKDIDFDQYLALQHEAAVFIVSSFREGLNLTCHEFVEASSDRHSPLILSEFTGSSHLLDCKGQGALLVNPWDIKSFSEAIKKALTMPAHEKRVRWSNCHQVVLKHKPTDWIKECLASTERAWQTDHLKTQTYKKPFTKQTFENFYESANGQRLFIINFDTSYSHNEAGLKSTKGFSNLGRIINMLTGLTSDSKNLVFILSILKTEDLDLVFKNVPNLGLIAESGGFIKLVGQTKWISIIDKKEVGNWITQVALLVKSKVERLPQSSAVVEECTVRWLADSAVKEDPKRSFDAMGDCIQHINDIYGDSQGIHATLIDNSVVVQQKDISLRAIQFIVACYTTTIPAAKLAEKFQVKRVASFHEQYNSIVRSPLAERFDWIEEDSRRTNSAQALLYSGGLTSIDEAIYEYTNGLEKDVFRSSISVAITGGQVNARSSALYSVLGRNELFMIITSK